MIKFFGPIALIFLLLACQPSKVILLENGGSSASALPTPTPYLAYDTIRDSDVGVFLTQRRILAISGPYVVCTDNFGNSWTDCIWTTVTPQPTSTPQPTPTPHSVNHGVDLFHSVDQALIAGNLAFDSERLDTDNYHSSSPNTTITIPNNFVGIYKIRCQANLSDIPGNASAFASLPDLTISLNSTPIAQAQLSNGRIDQDMIIPIEITQRFIANDTLTCRYRSNGAGTITIYGGLYGPMFSAVYQGP
jgi:hypothetical protein